VFPAENKYSFFFLKILINSNFDYEIEDYIKDNDGRFLISILKVNNEKILLANYYGLNFTF
jgi:hypothetical protein